MNGLLPIAGTVGCAAVVGAVIWAWEDADPERLVCKVPGGFAESALDFSEKSHAPCMAFSGDLPAKDVAICFAGTARAGSKIRAEKVYDVDLSKCGPAKELLADLEADFGYSSAKCAASLSMQVETTAFSKVKERGHIFVGCRLKKVS